MKTIHSKRYKAGIGLVVICQCAEDDQVDAYKRKIRLTPNKITVCQNCGRKYFWRDEVIMYEEYEEVFG